MTIRDIAIAFGYKVDEQSAKKAEDGIKSLKGMATKLLGAIGIGFSLVGLNEIAEEFNGINDQIRSATSELGEQKEIQKQILAAANDSKMSYKDTAKFVGSLVQENKDLFATVEDATEYASLTSKLFLSAGKSQEEVASLQEAINKSFAKGIVDSETINQLYERAPEAINMIAESLGVAKENLGKMATEGTISLADLKNAFVDNADAINRQFGGLDYSVSDAMRNIKNQWGLFVDEINGTLGVTKSIGKIMVQGFEVALGGLKKALDWIKQVAKGLGGMRNLFKLAAMAGAAIFIALNSGKILNFFKMAIGGLKGINKQMILAQLKTLAIIAVIMAVFLIIDDIINFVKGNDSVIGVMFEKAGIDSEKARETIKGAWNAITGFLLKAWETIKKTGEKVWGGLSSFWAKNGAQIMDTLSKVWNGIKTAAVTIFNALKAFWDRWGAQITAQFQILWNYLGKLIGAFLQVVRGIIDVIAGIFTGDWDRVWQGIKGIFEGIWNAISSFFMTVWNTIYNWFGGKIEAIKTTLVNGFNGAIDFMKSLPAKALQWGKDFIDGLINGIKEKVSGVVDAVKGVGEKIKSFLHFSRPDEGPLTDYESWMPDFMFGMAEGIRKNSPKVLEAIRALTKDMSLIGDVSVKNATATAVQGGGSRTTNVNQTNNIKNEFKGGDRAAQTQGAKAMGKSAEDVTDYLARGLAYGR